MTAPGPTPSQTIGPFFRFAMDWLGGSNNGPNTVAGTVFDGAGDPVPDALLEFWLADASGGGHFGRCLTNDHGGYEIATVKPGRVDDHQAPHIDVSVFARGLLNRLVTRIYFPDQAAANDVDPVLTAVPPDRRATLIARGEGDPLRFDIHLQGDQETVFFAW